MLLKLLVCRVATDNIYSVSPTGAWNEIRRAQTTLAGNIQQNKQSCFIYQYYTRLFNVTPPPQNSELPGTPGLQTSLKAPPVRAFFTHTPPSDPQASTRTEDTC